MVMDAILHDCIACAFDICEIYLCMYASMHVWTYGRMDAWMHACMYVNKYVCTYGM